MKKLNPAVRLILFTGIFCYGFSLFAQSLQTLAIKQKEDSLQILFKQITKSKNDTEKKTVNRQIIKLMQNAVETNGSFTYPFDSLKNLGKIKSNDDLVRIFTWDLTYNDGTYEYFGFIQYHLKNQFLVFPLIDKRTEITDCENAALNNQYWYGALYFEVVTQKINKKTYYTLLGWDGNNDFTTKKLIDILYFDTNGYPFFGAQIFSYEKKTPYRVVFEFSKKTTMSLKYDKSKDAIVFDHLSPSKPEYTGQYQFYGPDFSYDGFIFTKGLWTYKMDLDMRNPKKK